MQNRSAIWVFTILLAIAALYSLSFTYFTGQYEKERDVFVEEKLKTEAYIDSTEQKRKDLFEDEYDKEYGEDPLVPIMGTSYNRAKQDELKKGLDLEGGFSAVIELSISDLVRELAGNPDEEFNKVIDRAVEMQREAEDDFVTLFERAWNEIQPDKKMISNFHSQDNKEFFPLDLEDNGDLVEVLRQQANGAIDNAENIIRARVDKYGVVQPTIQKQAFSGRILVELPGVSDKERFRKLLRATANLEFWKTFRFLDFQNALGDVNRVAAEKLGLENEEPEIDPNATWDVNDPTTYTVNGQDTIYIPPVAETTTVNALFGDLIKDQSLINPNDEGESWEGGCVWGYVNEADRKQVMELLNDPEIRNYLEPESRLKFAWSNLPKADGRFALYGLKIDSEDGEAALDGKVVINASQDFDPYTSEVLVSLTMNSDGAAKWSEITEEAAKDNRAQVAIAMDGDIYSAPSVNEKIPSGRSSITIGGQNKQEAIQEGIDLSNLLKAGSLPARADIVNEQIVGSTIGKENIQKGITSFIIALCLILVYMFLYYKGAGLAADIALIANLFFLMGALASIHAALTLPGIAGIILTIGMSVDANVLIFERVKEELRAGAGLQAAMKKGYNKAYSAIVDANVTTFLTAVILFVLGSGPIKGFATTLMIGIFTSLFTAIFITRMIFSWRSEAKKPVTFFWNYSKDLFSNTNFNFVGRRKVFYGVSAVLIGIGIGSLFTSGLDLGVDFDGGRKYVINFQENVEDQKIEELRNSLGVVFTENGNIQNPTIKRIGTIGKSLEITTKYLINDNSENVDNLVDNTLFKGLQDSGLSFDKESDVESNKVDPTISDGFKQQATLAVIVSLLIIFLYIALRFRKWQYGLGAIIAMTHDVLIVLGLFSIGYSFFPFSMEIDQAFIAAILTVVGYSINDTVVVFDRIREYLNENKKGEPRTIVNAALNSTLSRTLNTSVSTFIVLLIIFLFGSNTIKGFTFALMVGVVVGTYSSLFIATPIVVDLTKNLGKRS
ncbi:MAG: protein translocase subunit SecDF [Bacteroidota bacterium]